MRILKVTQTYYPYLNKGGPPAKVSGIAKVFAQRGHEVTVLTADLGQDDRADEAADWKREKTDLGWQSSRCGVQTIYLPTLVRYRAATINHQVFRFCTQRLSEYDVVHVYGLYDLLGCVVARFCASRGIPYVLEPLGMFGPKVRSKRKKRLYSWLVGNALFERAQKVIATSEAERAELVEGGIDYGKILVRRNGLDLSKFQDLPARGAFRAKHKIGDQQPLILFLGRLSFIKGLDLLVQAFSLVGGQAKLIIGGPDDGDGCIQSIRQLIDELNLGERVILTDPLHERETLQAFVDATIVVLTSRHESFGNTAAESIACGTPVLLTDRCGIAPLIEGKAGLVVPCSVEGIFKGINLLLEDKALLAMFSKGCDDVARTLSWDEPVEAMETIYASIVKSRVILSATEITLPQRSC